MLRHAGGEDLHYCSEETFQIAFVKYIYWKIVEFYYSGFVPPTQVKGK